MNEVEVEKSLRKELIGEVSDDTFHKNYLIEAGAGAGKTFILSLQQKSKNMVKPARLRKRSVICQTVLTRCRSARYTAFAIHFS